jgi:hypothetical protein
MSIKSSHLSLTSLAQKAILYSHESLTKSPAVNAVVSRVAALLLSPAAALDLAFHTAATPITLLYSIGKSIIVWKRDFSLPWQHLQRIREAVIPILFGSISGIIHPYAGIYFSEPRDKHIAGGILLSTTSAHSDVVISPVSAFEEVSEIMQSTDKRNQFPEPYRNLVKSLVSWEKTLEMIQSVELFDLKLTFKGMSAIYRIIDDTNVSYLAKGIAKRIALFAYPILAALDLTVSIASSLLLLGVGAIQMIGGKGPAYLETTNSPVLHTYQLAKIVMGVVSAVVGFGVSLFNPEEGLKYSFPSSKNYHMLNALMFPIFKRIDREVKALDPGERIVLPIVTQNRRDSIEEEILPSRNSHMTYLLIENHDKDGYSAELIERGNSHGIAKQLSRKDVCKVAHECLSLRYFSLNCENGPSLSKIFDQPDDLLSLGKQGSLSNCVITNLFAVLQVLHHRDKGDPEDLSEKIKIFRAEAMDRYDHYQYDFFPFAPMDLIIKEVLALKSKRI